MTEFESFVAEAAPVSEAELPDNSLRPAPGQEAAPYAEAVEALAKMDWQHLHVPAHNRRPGAAPGLAKLVGEKALSLEFPMLFSQIDQETWSLVSPGRSTPLMQAQDLAAEFWGASRSWFLTNGGSGCNHIAMTVARALGREVVMQRSVHSSVIDGMTHVGVVPNFVHGSVDLGLGAAHGVTAQQVSEALLQHPESTAVFIVSPSYFGAVADVAAIADVAHAHGVPLIVDEAWGSHFGVHPDLPTNAIANGADLVVSSTQKGAGSLAQTAMLHLGTGPVARDMESLVDRVVRSYQSTSCSALLLSSLDVARQHLAVNGATVISQTLETAQLLREAIDGCDGFREASSDALAFADVVAVDPLKIAIDTRGAGITGTRAHNILLRDHKIYCELSTDSALLLLVGSISPANVERLVAALDALPRVAGGLAAQPLALPGPCERAMGLDEAFYSEVEVVPLGEAVGRISADSLAAYPPGVPNVLPGEVLSNEVVEFLRATAAAPSGHVRGAVDPALDFYRVVK